MVRKLSVDHGHSALSYSPVSCQEGFKIGLPKAGRVDSGRNQARQIDFRPGTTIAQNGPFGRPEGRFCCLPAQNPGGAGRHYCATYQKVYVVEGPREVQSAKFLLISTRSYTIVLPGWRPGFRAGFGRILAGRARSYGRPSAGRRSDFAAFPIGIAQISGSADRSPARKRYCAKRALRPAFGRPEGRL